MKNPTPILFGKLVGAPPDNKNGERFKTPEKRKEFLDAYVKHCEKGKADESFLFEGAGIRTFKNYIQNYPIEFPSETIEAAHTARFAFWETIGTNGLVGKPVYYPDPNGEKNPHDKRKPLKLRGGPFNSRTWEFNMQNRFGWKVKTDVTTDDKPMRPMVIMDK